MPIVTVSFYQRNEFTLDLPDDFEELSFDDLMEIALEQDAWGHVYTETDQDHRAALTWENPDGSVGEAFPE